MIKNKNITNASELLDTINCKNTLWQSGKIYFYYHIRLIL